MMLGIALLLMMSHLHELRIRKAVLHVKEIASLEFFCLHSSEAGGYITNQSMVAPWRDCPNTF
jgi:hypothetical protein